MHFRRCDRQVVENSCHGSPYGQSWEPLSIERHDNGVAGMNINACAAVEPALGTGIDAAIGAHHVDSLAVGLACRTAALIDIVVARHTAFEQMRRGILNFAEYHDFLA